MFDARFLLFEQLALRADVRGSPFQYAVAPAGGRGQPLRRYAAPHVREVPFLAAKLPRRPAAEPAMKKRLGCRRRGAGQDAGGHRVKGDAPDPAPGRAKVLVDGGRVVGEERNVVTAVR